MIARKSSVKRVLSGTHLGYEIVLANALVAGRSRLGPTESHEKILDLVLEGMDLPRICGTNVPEGYVLRVGRMTQIPPALLGMLASIWRATFDPPFPELARYGPEKCTHPDELLDQIIRKLASGGMGRWNTPFRGES